MKRPVGRSFTAPFAEAFTTFVGFDLHERYITACALDAAGEIVAEIRQLSTAVEAVHAWLDALPGPVTVELEATLYWEWLATRLIEHGHTVRVAHASRTRLRVDSCFRPMRRRSSTRLAPATCSAELTHQ